MTEEIKDIYQSTENAFRENVERIRRKGKELQYLTGSVLQGINEINEIVEATERLQANVPRAIDYESQIELLDGIEKQLDDGLKRAQKVSNVVSVAKSLAYMSTTSGSVTISEISDRGLIDVDMVSFVLEYEKVISRPSIIQEINELLLMWGLDIARSGKQSPYEKFNNAHSQFELEKLSHLSLIEIRECIKLIIDALIVMRPFQEPAPNERNKIISICHQLQRNGIKSQYAEELANQWHALGDSLSVGKQSDLSKDEIRRRLIQATTFIGSLLHFLDISKAKKPRRKRHQPHNPIK